MKLLLTNDILLSNAREGTTIGGFFMTNEKEIVLFETEDKNVSFPVKVENETVWLSANQMALLFERDEKTIRKHINNVFDENEF